jgi:CRP-like cAMP-binding protein
MVFVANIAYLLMLCAFVTRDVLYLRTLLVVAQSAVVIYTWSNGVRLVSGWNLLFAAINGYMAIQIVKARRAVELPDDLRQVHADNFAALSPGEFLRLWTEGERLSLQDQRMAREGTRPEWLYFLLDGRVRVSRGGESLLELSSGDFVCEMSLLTGEPANSDVDAVGPVTVMRWSTAALQQLRMRDAPFWTKIQSALGHDLVEKIRRGEPPRPARPDQGPSAVPA